MVKFIKSSNYVSEYFEDKRNQICLIGRSNAGKSSLINVLANQSIAKTSSTPGKTQLVNFFDFGNFVLVDLPGYGYAKTNKKNSMQIQSLIFEYLNYSKKLKAIFHLCSIDVITNQDIEISNELKKVCDEHNFYYYVLLTKSDKLNNSKINQQVKNVSNFLKVEQDKVIPISSKKKININIIHSILNKIA